MQKFIGAYMHIKNCLKNIVCLTLLTLCTHSFAQYRWVDNKGRTVYSDAPPPVQEKVKNVNIITFVKSKNKALPLMQHTNKPSESAAPASSVAAMETKKSFLYDKQACEQLEGYLRVLQDGGRVAKLKSSGEKSFLDDKEREKEVSDTQKRVNDQCKKSASNSM
jgi:Domain of unknown function (DUF4124)